MSREREGNAVGPTLPIQRSGNVALKKTTKVESPVGRCFSAFNYGRNSIPTIQGYGRKMDTS